MSSSAKAPLTAGEFLAMNATNVIMNTERVSAVLVIVAMDPLPGEKAATVIMNPWGGSRVDQAALLRGIADRLDQTAAAAEEPAARPTLN